MNHQDNSKSNFTKFVYINQNLFNEQLKVLINPNFMYVKPHFNKNFLINQTIHVNPNKIKELQTPEQGTSTIKTPTKLIRIPQNNSKTSKTRDTNSSKVVYTRTKLIRVNPNNELQKLPKHATLHTKYKIVRETPLKKSTKKVETDVRKLYYIKNRFRIDKRSPAIKKVRASPRSSSLDAKNVYVKHKSKLNRTNCASINGILCKKTNNSKSKPVRLNQNGKSKLLTIRGQKYKLDSNHRTLTLIVKDVKNAKPNFKTIYLGGVTFKQKEANVFVKTNSNQKRIFLSQAKQRSINILTNKMKKSNIPCPMYRKFGRCMGREKGTCIRIHNPNQISLCPKFLQGACINEKCLLSHKLSATKMPTCKFFLEGLCSRDNCPYLHVKISAKAEICKDFLQGFCEKAAECEKRHQYLCPDFERSGKCPKRKCLYPHGSAVRKYNNFTSSKLHPLKISSKNHPVTENKIIEIDDFAKDYNARYYNELSHNSSGEIPISVRKKQCNDNFEIVDSDDVDDTITEENGLVDNCKKRRRPSVGDLPSFIPFLDEKQNCS